MERRLKLSFCVARPIEVLKRQAERVMRQKCVGTCAKYRLEFGCRGTGLVVFEQRQAKVVANIEIVLVERARRLKSSHSAGEIPRLSKQSSHSSVCVGAGRGAEYLNG